MGAMQTLVFENYVSPVMFVEATLHEFVSRGLFDPNVEAIQEALHERRDAMITALARELPEGTSWNEPDGGYFLWVDLPSGLSAESLLDAGGRGGRRLHQGARLLLPRRRRLVDAARVLLRAARGDRRGHRAARAARARRARRRRREPARLRDRPPRRARPLRRRVRHDPDPDPARDRGVRGQRLRLARGGRARDRGARRARRRRGPARGALRRARRAARPSRSPARSSTRPPARSSSSATRPTRRGATAAEPDTTVLVVGGTVGKAFEPSPWESWLEALPFYDAKDYDRGRRDPGARARGAPGQPERPLQPRLLRGAGRAAGRGARPPAAGVPSSIRGCASWAAADSDLDVDQGRCSRRRRARGPAGARRDGPVPEARAWRSWPT